MREGSTEAKDRAAEEAKIAAAKLALEEMMRSEAQRRSEEDQRRRATRAELERLVLVDRSLGETEERRRAAFDLEIERLSKLAEDEARRQEASVRAAEEARKLKKPGFR